MMQPERAVAQPIESNRKRPVSKLRKIYIARLAGRCLTFLLGVVLWFVYPSVFDIVGKGNFFKEFSLLHLLWSIWVIDMLLQLFPVKTHISLGSQKHFRFRYRPAKGKTDKEALKQYTLFTAKGAGKVFLIYGCLVAVIGILYRNGILDDSLMILISMFFFVCDLICVLIWCPFRLLMKTRCCTTCRIFNWDHLMMFAHLAFVPGFFTQSLFWMSLAVWLFWEACILLYPERFWEKTNVTLRCGSCTDKLCTQYCGKKQNHK